MSFTLTSTALVTKELASHAFDVLLESDDLNLRYSFATTTAGGYSWEHRLLHNGIGDIVQETPPGGGIAAVATLRVLVVDDGTGQSISKLVEDFGRVKGADITLSILLEGEAYADKVAIFGGVIDHYSRDGMITEIIAVDETFKADKLLPIDIIPQNDPDAAESAFGRAVPLVYGDGSDVVLAPLLLTDEAAREYKSAKHPMRTFSADRYAIFVNDVQKAKDRTGDATTSTFDATLTLSKSLSEVLFGSGSGTLSIAREQAVTNSSLAIDTFSTTFATIATSSATDSNGEGYGYIGVAGAWTTPEGSNILQYEVLQHRGSSAAAATLNASFKLRLTDSGGSVLRDDLDRTGDFRFFSNYRDYRREMRDILLQGNQKIELLIEAFNEGGAGTSTEFWKVGEVSMSLGAQAPGDQAQLYLYQDWQGRPDDHGGTYTGTGSALIEIPSDVIWSIVDFELSISYWTVKFVEARVDEFVNWKFAGGIGAGWYKERESARELLNRMAIQCKSILWFYKEGLIIEPFNSSASSQYSFTADTILWESGHSIETPPSARRSTFRINQEVISEVWNRFEIHYAYSAGARKFNKIKYANASGTNSTQSDAADLTTLCVNSQNRYGQSAALVIDADFIYDDTTAELLLDHLVRYFWDERINVNFETSTQGLHLHLGDLVDITYPDLPNFLQAADFEIHRLRYRFIPVGAPSGNTALSFRIGILASRILGIDFSYFGVKDQSDMVWYGLIPIGQTFGIQDTVPAQPGLIAIDLTPSTIPYWLEFEAFDDGSSIYVYPDDTSSTESFWIVDTSPPAVGTGWFVGGGLQMRSIDGVAYVLRALSYQQIVIDPLSETGAITATRTVTDSATASDTPIASGAGVSDNATATENIVITVSGLVLSDSAMGVDNIDIPLVITIIDAASATDIVAATYSIPVSDILAGSDSPTVSVSVMLPEETANVDEVVTQLPGGSTLKVVTDTATGGAPLGAFEGGAFEHEAFEVDKNVFISASVPVDDTATGSDVIDAFRIVADSASVSDVPIAPRWPALDETSADDTDYVESGLAPSGDILEVKTTALPDPASSSSHILRYRFRKDAASGATVDLRVSLYEGDVEIAWWGEADISDTWTTQERTLSTAEANSITYYTDLRIRFTATEISGSPSRRAHVSWCEFETPAGSTWLFRSPETATGSDSVTVTT